MKQIYIILILFLTSITLQSQVLCTFDIPDTFVCSGTSINLSVGSGYTSVLWDNGATTPSTTITTTGRHWARVTKIDTTVNLVVNGDFEAGRTGFTSGYIIGLPGSSTWGLLGNPGTYEVLASPRDGHINFYTCTDMTPAPGTQMFVANGSTTPTDFWCQTITVTPNTDYLFSAWVASVENTTNVAQLQFKINGTVIGTATASGPWPASGENVIIGYAGFHSPMIGDIDVAKLYNRALTSTEITNNYLKYKRQYGLT